MILSGDQFSKILNIIIASSRMKQLSLPHRDIRPFIHCLIWGEIGIGKSTILYDIAKERNITPIRALTPAVILGSVDKTTGILNQPIIWENRNNVVLIDEFHLEKNDKAGRGVLNELLVLMENPRYQKSVGYRTNDVDEVDDDLFLKVKNGKILCNTRVSFIIDTMMDIKKKSQMREIYALKSRCITINLCISYDELEEMASGKHYFRYKKVKIKKKIVKINKKTYEMIKKYARNRLEKSRYLRVLGDLCRIYAVLGKIDEEIFNIVCELSKD